jgi:hypothetical protein
MQRHCSLKNSGEKLWKNVVCAHIWVSLHTYRIAAEAPLKFKNSILTAMETPHFTVSKINWLTLFKEIVFILSWNDVTVIKKSSVLLIAIGDGRNIYRLISEGWTRSALCVVNSSVSGLRPSVNLAVEVLPYMSMKEHCRKLTRLHSKMPGRHQKIRHIFAVALMQCYDYYKKFCFNISKRFAVVSGCRIDYWH